MPERSTVKYRVIAADPGWAYRDSLRMADTKRSAGDLYTTMSVDKIVQLGTAGTVAGHESTQDAFLFLWVTNPFLLDGSGVRVCRGWGFDPQQLITWVKGRIETKGRRAGQLIPHIGMGHVTRGTTEHLIVGTRGAATKHLLDRGVPNFFLAPRTKHSSKPAEAYALIERIAPGPYVELFAREARPGWDRWGNQAPE